MASARTIAVRVPCTGSACPETVGREPIVNSDSPKPARYSVLFHTPGPGWVEGLSFREQPEVMSHIRYMAEQMEAGLILMGGPFLDDSGGMMICTEHDLERAQEIADDDPAVRSGLLEVRVTPWYVPMSALPR